MICVWKIRGQVAEISHGDRSAALANIHVCETGRRYSTANVVGVRKLEALIFSHD